MLVFLPLWSPGPVFHSQQLNVRCLAGNFLRYLCCHFWWLSNTEQILKEPTSVWVRKEDGAVVLYTLCGHREWVVG